MYGKHENGVPMDSFPCCMSNSKWIMKIAQRCACKEMLFLSKVLMSSGSGRLVTQESTRTARGYINLNDMWINEYICMV